jgi:hypothetical protein
VSSGNYVTKDEVTTPILGLAMISAFLSTISAWPWSMAAALVAVCTFLVVLYVNIVKPRKRLKDLIHPVTAYFVIPRLTDHRCDFAKQDGDEHLVKTITLQARSEVIVDLVLIPKLYFISSEVYFGCEGGRSVRDRPYASKYINRFIEVGSAREIEPGTGSAHYIDKYHFYHVKEPAQWSVRSARAIAFRIITNEPGCYPVKIFFPGDAVEGVSEELLICVEESPTTRMHCACPEHAHMACAVGICPITEPS